ncbi:MAG: maleylacetoacetate isomerase [Gammaproteobacteria bacterium]
MFELHDFSRSSAAYRVRIALAYKGIDYQRVDVDLLQGAQHEAGFRSLNPEGLVPVYSDEHQHLSQSLAILEYLEERYPQPSLLPGSREERARARQIASIVACDIHPLNGFRVHVYLRDSLGVDTRRRRAWFTHWLAEGLDAIELWLTAHGGQHRYAIGDAVSLADVCLVPQADVARRNGLDLDDYPRVAAVERACMELPAFRDTHPDAIGAP